MTPSASSSSLKRSTRKLEHDLPAPPAPLSFSSHTYTSASSDSHSHSQDPQAGSSSSCSSPPISPTWREARTRDWPVPTQRRRRYDTEGDGPPIRERGAGEVAGRGSRHREGAGSEAKVVKAIAALEKDLPLPGSRLLSDGQDTKSKEKEALRARRSRGKKSRKEKQQSTANTAARRKKASRTFGGMILLPLQYLLLVLLHLGFWIITASLRALARSRRWLRRRGSAGERRVEELAQLGGELLEIRRRNTKRQEEKGSFMANSKGELRVPQHVALAFPPSPPPTSTLLARLLLRYLTQLLPADSEATSSSRSSIGLFGKSSPPSARQLAYQETEAARRVLSLRNAVRWCAILGVSEVSVWDEGGEISRWLASGSQRGFEPCSGLWRIDVNVEEEQVPIVIEVRDGERRRQLAMKTSKVKLQNGKLQSHTLGSEEVPGSPLYIVLNLLAPRWDGRTAFATLSGALVGKVKREGEDVVTGDSPSHKGINGHAGVDKDWLSKRIDNIGVAEVDEELRGQGLPHTEPDLLIVSGGDPIARTLSDFPRWMIRVTEIFHAPASAALCSSQDSDVIRGGCSIAQLSIHDFFAALEQFTNAEQRYGK